MKGFAGFPVLFPPTVEEACGGSSAISVANHLTNLEGCPMSVGGNFNCDNNKLLTLEFCPSDVGGSFYCFDNKITSLIGFHYE